MSPAHRIPTNYAIKTPVATLGIRGTIVDLQVSPIETFIGVLEGLLNLRLADGTSLTVRKGQYVVVAAGGVLRSKGPYTGCRNPNMLAMPDNTRIDGIDQLNAIDARNAPTRPQEPPCYDCSYRNFRSGR